MSSKCLLNCKIENWALGTLKRDHLNTPSSSHLHLCNTEQQRLRRWNCSFTYPQADVLPSFTQTEQQAMSPLPAVTSVKPAQTIRMGLRPTPSHTWREGRSSAWHKLSSVHSVSNWTCRPSTVHRQAVSGWSDPQWITGSWPQEFCLPGFNS